MGAEPSIGAARIAAGDIPTPTSTSTLIATTDRLDRLLASIYLTV